MAIFYSNSVLQASNYENPIEEYETLYYTDVSPFFSKEITMKMTDNEIRTQSAITRYMPYQSRYVTVASEFSTSLVQISNKDFLPQRLIRVVVQMDGKKQIINRSYQTLFEVLAVLGGVYKLFSFFCFCLSSIISPTVLKLDLALKLSHSGHALRSRSSDCIQSPLKDYAKQIQTPKIVPQQSTVSPKPKKIHPSRQASIRSHVSHFSVNSRQAAPTIREANDANGVELVPRIPTPEQPSSQPSSNQEEQLTTKRVEPTIQNCTPPSSSRKKMVLKKNNPTSTHDLTDSFHHKVQNIGFCAIFLYCCMPFLMPKNAQIKKIVDHLDKKVMKKFDFMNLIRMMDDIEKLKLMLLNQEEQAIFEQNTVEQVASLHSTTKPQEEHSIQLIELNKEAQTKRK